MLNLSTTSLRFIVATIAGFSAFPHVVAAPVSPCTYFNASTTSVGLHHNGIELSCLPPSAAALNAVYAVLPIQRDYSTALKGPTGTKPSGSGKPNQHTNPEERTVEALATQGRRNSQLLSQSFEEAYKGTRHDEKAIKKEVAEWKNKYYYEPETPARPLQASYVETFHKLGIDTSGRYVEVFAMQKDLGAQKKANSEKGQEIFAELQRKGRKPLLYQNQYDVESGTIISENVYKAKGEIAETPGQQLFYSDFTAVYYIHLAQLKKADTAGLRKVVVEHVANSETQGIIKELIHQRIPNYDPKRREDVKIDLSKHVDADFFFALQASQNLGFINRMLRDYRDVFHRKQIVSIVVTRRHVEGGAKDSLAVVLESSP